jgi:hypothetical protein
MRSGALRELGDRIAAAAAREVGNLLERTRATVHPLDEMNRRMERRLLDALERDEAVWCRSGEEVRAIALERRQVEGLIVEFGVYTGQTIRFWASNVEQTVHGFDSFEGLPDGDGVWKPYISGDRFNVGERLPDVPANVTLHKGWFSDTLPGFCEAHAGPISLAHVDCDIYSSTKTIFDTLGDRFVPGSVIVFDEYFNYPGWQFEEYRAFQEFVKARKVAYSYLAFGANKHRYGAYAKVALRIDAVGR